MSDLVELGTLVKNRLAGLTELNDIPVICEDEGDLDIQLDKALSELGVGVILQMPRFDNTQLESQVLNGEALFDVIVGENVLLRVPGAPVRNCLRIAQACMQRLHGWFPSANYNFLVCHGFHFFKLYEKGKFTGRQVYEFSVKVNITLQPK